MIRTLHTYLSRELAKTTFLALVAFTLVMTVFAIIEPLRKQQGMAPEQIMALFGYMMPVTLSLTLPIAALFAATIAYGRFSQDNELLACQASGIPTLRLLRPAVMLGLAVTAISLTLSNFVAPHMIANSKTSLQKNIRGIAYSMLRSHGYIEPTRGIMIHADYVDELNDILYGVTAVDSRDPRAKVMVASKAYLKFLEFGDDHYLQIHTDEPQATAIGRESTFEEKSQDLVIPLENPIQEQASWLDWKRMLETVNDPVLNRQVADPLEKYKVDLGHDMVATDIVGTINSGRAYEWLQRDVAAPGAAPKIEQYVLRAPKAALGQNPRSSSVSAELTGEPGRPVQIEIRQNGKVVQTYSCPSAKVEAKWGELTRMSLVNIDPKGPITWNTPDDPRPQVRATFPVGELPIPSAIANRLGQISLRDLYVSAKDYTSNPRILGGIADVRNYKASALLSEIKAEMHSRVAYSMSCFLLVVLGAALGLMFRGGQFISAFAIAAIPGSFVIIMLLMGKSMLQNTKVINTTYFHVSGETWGLVAIWCGIVLLALANLVVYGRLARK